MYFIVHRVGPILVVFFCTLELKVAKPKCNYQHLSSIIVRKKAHYRIIYTL